MSESFNSLRAANLDYALPVDSLGAVPWSSRPSNVSPAMCSLQVEYESMYVKNMIPTAISINIDASAALE